MPFMKSKFRLNQLSKVIYVRNLAFACAAHCVCRKVVIVISTTSKWVLIIIVLAISSMPTRFSIVTVLTLSFEKNNG